MFFYSMLGSVNLTRVEVKGVAAALDKHTPKGESKGVKAFFRMDENGLLTLEKVSFETVAKNQMSFYFHETKHSEIFYAIFYGQVTIFDTPSSPHHFWYLTSALTITICW